MPISQGGRGWSGDGDVMWVVRTLLRYGFEWLPWSRYRTLSIHVSTLEGLGVPWRGSEYPGVCSEYPGGVRITLEGGFWREGLGLPCWEYIGGRVGGR